MNRYKTSGGQFRTLGLFYEYSTVAERKVLPPIYTILDQDKEAQDGNTYPSLGRLYVDCGDPTEYQFALKHLGGWRHWLKLRKNKLIAPYVQAWRDELEVKLRSRGVIHQIEEVQNGGKGANGAAKWLAEKGFSGEDNRGRPSKKAIADEARKLDRMHEDIDEHLERMDDVRTH